MRVVVLTSNQRRHRYLVNRICQKYSDVLVVCETQSSATGREKTQSIGIGPSVFRHFQNIIGAEEALFAEANLMEGVRHMLPIPLGELSAPFVLDAVRDFAPQAGVVFGSSWIKEPLLSALPPRRTYNIHMGVSPYYRGHSTNFWAFANGDPDKVGATILELAPELDQGNIVCHVPLLLEPQRDYYYASMKIVISATDRILDILAALSQGRTPSAQAPAPCEGAREYASKQFTEEVAEKFLQEHPALYERYLSSSVAPSPDLVPLTFTAAGASSARGGNDS